METQIKKSFRKSISLRIKNGILEVRAPLFMSASQIQDFIAKHADWIEKQFQKPISISLADDERDALKKQARAILPDRVAYYADQHDLSYNAIRITSARTRWGSCSSQRNLNFSYRLMQTPEFVQDYVVVHELAHLVHMNHSKQFWKQVEHMYPEYREAEKWLKQHGGGVGI